MTDIHPSNLKEALSVTPLLHLIPRQDISPLISTKGIVASPDELELQIKNIQAQQLRNSINNPSHSDVADFFVGDFESFDDPELSDLKFYKGLDVTSTVKLELPKFEGRLFGSMKQGSKYATTSLNLERDNDVTRLSVRRSYPENERVLHNANYLRKYAKELIKMGITPKRSLESYEEEKNSPKRLQKSTYLLADEMRLKSFESLSSLLDRILQSTSGDEMWVMRDGKRYLSKSILIIIHDDLFRLANGKIIENLSLDKLMMLQELCQNLMHEANSKSWNGLLEDDSLFELCCHYILACKVMMLVLNATSDKRLFLEDYLKSTIQYICSLIMDAVVPFFGRADFAFPTAKPSSSLILPDLGTILSMISLHISRCSVDEHLLTQIEYLSVLIIFSDGSVKANSSLEGLKGNASNLLTQIFSSCTDQRGFILHEVLTNLDRLPQLKIAARQFKLTRGGNIQLTTALLVKFVESLNYEKLSVNGLMQTPSFILLSRDLLTESLQIANEISSFFISKLSQNADLTLKTILELFLEDLLTMLSYPEWPGSEVMLVSLLKSLLITVQQTSSSLAETFLLEMLGLVGEKILTLKRSSKTNFRLSTDLTEENCKLYQFYAVDCLEYLQLQVNKNVAVNPSMQFLALKLVNEMGPLLDGVSNEENSKEKSATEVAIKQTLASTLAYLVDSLTNNSIKLNQIINSDKSRLSVSSYTSLLLTQELPILYDNFLKMLLKFLDNPKIKTKTRAIKILTTLTDKDPLLLLSPYVQESISNRLTDSSPLVRDAVIELIGKYLSSRPDVIENFYQQICECMNDTSVQVRKRVIKICRDMYSSLKSRLVKVSIVLKLLRRFEDEDNVVQALSKSVLLDLLTIGRNPEEVEAHENTSLKENTQVMMEIISSCDKSMAPLELFILENSKQFLYTLKHILEESLEVVHNGCEVERPLKLISTFVKCDGSLISQDQLVSLQPFLLDDRGMISFYCLEILHYSLPCIKSLRPDYLNFVQEFLLKRLTKLNVKELNIAMPCVWRLSEMNSNTVKLTNATISCMRYIKPYIDAKKFQKEQEAKPDPKLQKLLHLLGCFGKYCKFEKHRDLFVKSFMGFKNKESVVSVMIKFMLHFCDQSTHPKIKCAAITNLVNICSTHPKLFLSDQILKVIDREFDGDDLLTKHSIIQGMMDFLSKEDLDTQKRNGSLERSSTSTKLDVAVFHGNAQSYVNDGICAGLTQRYLARILKLCLLDGGRFSYLPIKYLQLVIKLGFANPKLCILTIIALESSTNKAITSIAYELHQEIFEKHESLTGNSYLDGIKLAAEYRKRVSKDFLLENDYFESLYSIVKNNYSSKKKFVQSISKIFQIHLKQNLSIDKDALLYSAVNIAHLSFSSMEEVLIIIHSIDIFIGGEGVDLLEAIRESQNKEPQHAPATILLAELFCMSIKLREHLTSKYLVSVDKIDEYRPGKVDVELRQNFRHINGSPFVLPTYETVDLFEYFTKLMDEFS